ncbi:thioesterase family protein [Paenibacillus larvae]|uniref:Acyl-CoA thioesterase-like protein n=2 Tax=Paenibacillus larvae TaxID=1464 RepID=A0A2L1TXA5_9BACL|nr:thioesterase family protein [Paenibacillus larvae]AQR78144.1 thioesterase [Paenibacillus larvae subsp. larvae]AQT85837.1 thioesterase [Paenibacillus larvae subsp. pulvifaciens]AQZ45937.1 thioesterase [Paenibacillus larvae subsp. pulvifaciens]AVF20668.1 acyl-CoA thioesterase-like protein [Paenibacillus larvae subsp. larvae]AVF25248.1 acyl-CoA thioesterase-like protein [Paenibacillus larvae subsp. larvae]
MSFPWKEHHLRVRYAETDAMGVVYHANYLIWLEVGRTEFIREMGYPYAKMEEQGLLLPVVETNLRYRRPAKYDDAITVYSRIESFTPSKIIFTYEIRRKAEAEQQNEDPAGELLVTGTTVHVWINRSWNPVRIDKEAPELFLFLQENA